MGDAKLWDCVNGYGFEDGIRSWESIRRKPCWGSDWTDRMDDAGRSGRWDGGL